MPSEPSVEVAISCERGVSVLQSRLNNQYDASEYLPDFTQDASPDFRNRLDSHSAALDWRADWSAGWSTLLRVSTQESDSSTGGSADGLNTELLKI